MYDMLPIKLNSKYTDELAFKIGNATRATEITIEDYALFLGKFDLNESAAERFVKSDVTDIIKTIEKESYTILEKEGLKDFNDLFGMEAQRIIDVLQINLTLRERDFYASKGGGWSIN